MADSPCFDLACDVLERETSLERLEARGTVRLALKSAGLDPRTVTPEQMGVVADKLLPQELKVRGIENGAGICATLRNRVTTMAAPAITNAPEAVFARLGGE